jgi:hypothetical protein
VLLHFAESNTLHWCIFHLRMAPFVHRKYQLHFIKWKMVQWFPWQRAQISLLSLVGYGFLYCNLWIFFDLLHSIVPTDSTIKFKSCFTDQAVKSGND